MKYLVLVFMMLMGCQLYAQTCETVEVSTVETKEDVNTPTPKELEGATIMVKMKDGTTREMSANQFKVVPRKQQLKVKAKTITQNVNCKPYVEVHVKKVPTPQKNILSLEVNRSIGDYDVERNGGTVKVVNYFEPAVGIMYQRNIWNSWYVGGRIDTHRALGLSVGKGF